MSTPAAEPAAKPLSARSRRLVVLSTTRVVKSVLPRTRPRPGKCFTQPPTQIVVPKAPKRVLATDVNRDERLDLVGSSARDGQLYVSINHGDNVFDPYMGVGSSVVAAAMHDRVGYGCDVVKEYVDTAWDRVHALRAGTLQRRRMNKPVYDPALPKGGH